MKIELDPIGYVYTREESVPRHWSVSDKEGSIVVDRKYQSGIKDIHAGEEIIVIFLFDQSPPFEESCLIQNPPHKSRSFGVFSICSPRRPNPIGMSVLKVLEVQENLLSVKGIDMLNNTPVLDIKPCVRPSQD